MIGLMSSVGGALISSVIVGRRQNPKKENLKLPTNITTGRTGDQTPRSRHDKDSWPAAATRVGFMSTSSSKLEMGALISSVGALIISLVIVRRRRRENLKKENSELHKNIATAPPRPPWTELPGNVTTNILQRMGAVEIQRSAQYVCTSWRNLCKENYTWRVIVMEYQTDISKDNLKNMCRQAVDRSQGQLIDIKFVWHGTNQWLHYISERSTQLKCLRLSFCNISDEGLMEAITKFPNLEELHLFFMPTISSKAIRSIGISCPNLKSFTITRDIDWNPKKKNNYAHAIAKNMHGLRHLKLLGDLMTNSGVEAILDGCPYLESLDLRHCFNVNLREGKLGERCSQQIRDFCRPHDPVDYSKSDYFGW